jgi:hypothetical protein
MQNWPTEQIGAQACDFAILSDTYQYSCPNAEESQYRTPGTRVNLSLLLIGSKRMASLCMESVFSMSNSDHERARLREQ